MTSQLKSIIKKLQSLKTCKGKIVAIEPSSGKWFMGDSPLEVILQGEKKFPDAIFHIIKIGYKAAGIMKKTGKAK